MQNNEKRRFIDDECCSEMDVAKETAMAVFACVAMRDMYATEPKRGRQEARAQLCMTKLMAFLCSGHVIGNEVTAHRDEKRTR